MRKYLAVLLMAVCAVVCSCGGTGSTTPELLATPSGFTVSENSDGSIGLEWEAVKGAEGYYIYARKSATSTYYTDAVATVTQTAYTLSGLETGEDYIFSVQAFGKGDRLSKMASSAPVHIRTYAEMQYVDDGSVKVAAPSAVTVDQLSSSSVRVCWTDNSSDEKSFSLYLRESDKSVFDALLASVAAGTAEYTVTGLKTGGSYCIGVQAVGESVANNSPIVESDVFTLYNTSRDPFITVSGTMATNAYLGVRYSIANVSDTGAEHGLCFSKEHTPTVADEVAYGPDFSGGAVLQLISSASLEYGVTYKLRPYVKSGSSVYYGPVRELSLGEAPSEIKLQWSKLSTPSLPSAIEVYETTSKLNGRNFHAWYAIADCSGDVEFRVLCPTDLETIETQYEKAGDCHVLINGAIFGPSSKKTIGTVITDGMRSAWREEADGQYWGGGKLLQITRATFGVDSSGKPSACWSALPDKDHVYYYSRPLTTIAGEAAYPPCTGSSPATALSWTPKYAVTAGPMVLYDGRITVDLSKSESGYYTNYELWAGDIYPTHPDRSCVGCTADGKIVLFICDGRITSSDGAYVDELGRIMKGIGCVAAVNLDGGGSTGMMVTGLGHIGDVTAEPSRKVLSTMGFFVRKK